MTGRVSIRYGLRRIERLAALRMGFDQARFMRRVLGRSKRDLSRVLRQHVVREVRRATRRRTGRLLRVRIETRIVPGPGLILQPQFPFTAYRTPPGRGRRNRGRGDRGQYGFVLNANPKDEPRRFIQLAVAAFQADPKVPEILAKHARFILQQIIRGN